MKAGYTIEHDKKKLPFVVVSNYVRDNVIKHWSYDVKVLNGIMGDVGTWQLKGTKDKNNSYIA